MTRMQPTAAAVDDVVKARINAAMAGAAAPLSVSSAPNSAPYPAIAGPLPALPQYPPLGCYGSRLERVQAVSRFAPRRAGWNAARSSSFACGGEPVLQFDSIAAAMAQPAEPERASCVMDAQDENERYRHLMAWLRTHRQTAALRELAQLRRVLALAPADESGQSWQAHLMCPASPAPALRAPGAEGRSWPLRAQGAWVFTEPAKRWQHWRMRQHLRADGVWLLEPSRDGQGAPAWSAWYLDGGPQKGLPAPVNAIPLRLTEPQRLRRLLGTQWTVLVLRAPEPLDSRR